MPGTPRAHFFIAVISLGVGYGEEWPTWMVDLARRVSWKLPDVPETEYQKAMEEATSDMRPPDVQKFGPPYLRFIDDLKSREIRESVEACKLDRSDPSETWATFLIRIKNVSWHEFRAEIDQLSEQVKALQTENRTLTAAKASATVPVAPKPQRRPPTPPAAPRAAAAGPVVVEVLPSITEGDELSLIHI